MQLKTLAHKARWAIPDSLYEASRQRFGEWPRSIRKQQELADRIVTKFGTDVGAGPFAGTQYSPDAADGCVLPKLLGCYEQELFPVIERAVQRGYDRVVDIGCASGWYVAGFGRALPNAALFAFDTDADARVRCARNVERNGLGDRTTIEGQCTPARLQCLIEGKTLVICDIEGGEIELLDPERVPSLRDADLLVELHDFEGGLASELVPPRFASTHDIEYVRSEARTPSLESTPRLSALTQTDWPAAVDERRPMPMQWAILTSRR
jgi:hypothetical protein